MIDRLSNVFSQTRSFVLAKRKFTDYRPQAVTWNVIGDWLRPYAAEDRGLLHKLLRRVRYFSEEETRSALLSVNAKVVNQLNDAGLGLDRVIYVQVHDAGSSSGQMLNILRDTARIERAGCQFIDANSRKLSDVTRSVGEGAIIYVDDFAGSGKQFARVHKEISPYIVGRFVEFFIAPCVAEEAVETIASRGVEVVAHEVHKREQRPLSTECKALTSVERFRLLELSREMYASPGLGFKKLATMVVYARQCPNSVPLLLRGSERQEPYHGIFPRSTDLPSSFPNLPRMRQAENIQHVEEVEVFTAIPDPFEGDQDEL